MAAPDSDWLGAALVFLTAAVVAVPLAKRLGLGAILGYLVAGVLIGPQVLGLIHQPATVLEIGEFGVVLMIGGSIPGETRTLAISIYDSVQSFDLDAANTMSLALLMFSLVAVTTSLWLSGRRRRKP